jgi:hypothetical protein
VRHDLTPNPEPIVDRSFIQALDPFPLLAPLHIVAGAKDSGKIAVA